MGRCNCAQAAETHQRLFVQSPAASPFRRSRKWSPGRKDTARRQRPRDGNNACRRRPAGGNIEGTWPDPVPRVFSGSGSSGRVWFVLSCAGRPCVGSCGPVMRPAGGHLVVMALGVSHGCDAVHASARRIVGWNRLTWPATWVCRPAGDWRRANRVNRVNGQGVRDAAQALAAENRPGPAGRLSRSDRCRGNRTDQSRGHVPCRYGWNQTSQGQRPAAR